MRPRWIILGLFLAGIVYGTIAWWPQKPVWTTQLSKFSRLLAFSKDSKSIFVLIDKRKELKLPIDPYFTRWDALTGKLISETRIHVPEGFGQFSRTESFLRVDYDLSSDGAALLISGKTKQEGGEESPVLYVFETASGQKHLGPIDCAKVANGNGAFSKDGRAIVFFPRDEGCEAIDSKTAKRLLRVPNTEHESVRNVHLSSDGLLIAILVCHDSSAEDFSVRVFELSNGKELNRFSLPLREWQNLTSVDHHQITAVARVPDPNELEHIKKLFSFDLDSVPVGKETERPELERRIDKSYRVHTNWEEFDHGVDWRAEGRFGYSEPVWFWKCWDQCVGLLAAKKEDVKASLARLRLLPAKSRWVYYESPVFSETFSFQIAPDGKSFAAHSLEGELSVWNVNSFPRWPWALAASLGTLLLILLVGRSRSKRLARALDPLSLKGSPATPRAEGPGK